MCRQEATLEGRLAVSDRFSPQQIRPLALLAGARDSEMTEGSLWYEGINRPRATLESLRRRGLVERLEHDGSEFGYWYRLARGSDA